MEGSYGLFNRLIVEARPKDVREQDVEDTEKRLVSVLSEARDLGILVEDALEGLLTYIQGHLEKVRRYLETTDFGQRNLWRLHNLFCLDLNRVFPENNAAIA